MNALLSASSRVFSSQLHDWEGKYLAGVGEGGDSGEILGGLHTCTSGKDFYQCCLASQCNVVFHYPATVPNEGLSSFHAENLRSNAIF